MMRNAVVPVRDVMNQVCGLWISRYGSKKCGRGLDLNKVWRLPRGRM